MADMSAFFSDDNAGKAMDSASTQDTSGGSRIEYPGIYRCSVSSSKFKGKDETIYEFPNTSVSENKGSLLYNFIFEVVDGVDGKVKAGDYDYGMIVLSPKPGSTPKKYKDTMKMSKPRLKALLGEDAMEGFSYNPEWITENLLSDFKKKGDRYECVRSHNITNEIIVELELDDYNGKTKLSVKSIKSCPDNFVSKVTGPNINEEVFVDDNGDDDKDEKFMESMDADQPTMF